MAGDERPGAPATAGQWRGSVGYLLRYRVLALTTAVLLCVIVLVGLPLQLVAHRPELANVVGTIHGVLYVAYLVTAFQLTRRLGVPRWQMFLVLLAGTIPLCGFVAERKMTRRFASLHGAAEPAAPAAPLDRSLAARAARGRRRWLSRRALVLHLELLLVAPGCVAAGWWQATRALAGNSLSWFYSVEWPVFALIAAWGWWFLVHEDPAAYAARRLRQPERRAPMAAVSSVLAPARLTVSQTAATFATALALGTVAVFGTGIAALALIPFSRPNGWSPGPGGAGAVYVVHAVLGGALAFGTVGFVVLTRGSSRLARMSGAVGAVGVALASLGGLLTYAHALRLAGVGLMLLGVAVAGFGFCVPLFERFDRAEEQALIEQALAGGVGEVGERQALGGP